ncbi:hypothetical protein [Nocardia rhamnosiphila]
MTEVVDGTARAASENLSGTFAGGLKHVAQHMQAGDASWGTAHADSQRITRDYLNNVLRTKVDRLDGETAYPSMVPADFRPGCPDDELPTHLTRHTPRAALSDSVVPIDLSRVVVNYEGDGLRPIWRDRASDGAFLEPMHALFRMDKRGSELFNSGYHPTDPRMLNIAAHVGGLPKGSGFVSLSTSPEHAVGRLSLLGHMKVDPADIDHLVRTGDLQEDFVTGTYRETRYLHEVYHPFGIDVGGTFHDSQSARGPVAGSYNEAEILAPGGLSGNTIFRAWPREVIIDADGRVLSATVGEPIVNPAFKYADNA